MDMQTLLNQKYGQLVMKYGDLCYKRQVLSMEIAILEEEIKKLDASAPQLIAMSKSSTPTEAASGQSGPEASQAPATGNT